MEGVGDDRSRSPSAVGERPPEFRTKHIAVGCRADDDHPRAPSSIWTAISSRDTSSASPLMRTPLIFAPSHGLRCAKMPMHFATRTGCSLNRRKRLSSRCPSPVGNGVSGSKSNPDSARSAAGTCSTRGAICSALEMVSWRLYSGIGHLNALETLKFAGKGSGRLLYCP